MQTQKYKFLDFFGAYAPQLATFLKYSVRRLLLSGVKPRSVRVYHFDTPSVYRGMFINRSFILEKNIKIILTDKFLIIEVIVVNLMRLSKLKIVLILFLFGCEIQHTYKPKIRRIRDKNFQNKLKEMKLENELTILNSQSSDEQYLIGNVEKKFILWVS